MQVNNMGNSFIRAFGWMLVHSLWQGLLLTLIVCIALMLTRKWGSAARYNLLLIAIGGFLFFSVITLVIMMGLPVGGNIDIFATTPHKPTGGLFYYVQRVLQKVSTGFGKWFAINSYWIVVSWLLMFAARLLKTITALRYNQYIKQAQVIRADPYWTARVQRLAWSLQVKKMVQLLESGRLKVPVVIGHLKPVILVPISLLTSLSSEQATAIPGSNRSADAETADS